MKKRTITIILISFIVAGIFLYAFSNIRTSKDTEKGNRPQPLNAHQGHAPEPSPPQAQTAVPEEEQEVQTVEISPEQQRLIGLRTVEISVKPLQKTIRTVGIIEYDEEKLATINAKFGGWIEKLYVNSSGRFVGKGEPLAALYSPELLSTQREFLNLLKWNRQCMEVREETVGSMLCRDAEKIAVASRERLRLWDITDKQIDEIVRTGVPMRTLTIYSPVNGYVIQKAALLGARVMPGEKLFDIADLSTVWILSDIYEYELPLIRVGQKATVTLSYFPGKEFQSTIDYVYPALSGDTRTAKVRLTIPNQGGKLKPQMFSSVDVKIDLGKRLIVPEDAVLDSGTRQVVYVDKGDGYLEPREVRSGIRADGMVEIVHGLKSGERVASSANFLIDSEAKLKGVVQ